MHQYIFILFFLVKTVSSLECYACTNIEKLGQPYPNCLSNPTLTKNCSTDEICQTMYTLEKKGTKYSIYSVNRDCKKPIDACNKPCNKNINSLNRTECFKCCRTDKCLSKFDIPKSAAYIVRPMLLFNFFVFFLPFYVF